MTHVLNPHFIQDELLKFVRHQLIPEPGGKTDVEALYLTWKALPVRVRASLSCRTFRASETQWRLMLIERGIDLAGEWLVGYQRKGTQSPATEAEGKLE